MLSFLESRMLVTRGWRVSRGCSESLTLAKSNQFVVDFAQVAGSTDPGSTCYEVLWRYVPRILWFLGDFWCKQSLRRFTLATITSMWTLHCKWAAADDLTHPRHKCQQHWCSHRAFEFDLRGIGIVSLASQGLFNYWAPPSPMEKKWIARRGRDPALARTYLMRVF